MLTEASVPAVPADEFDEDAAIVALRKDGFYFDPDGTEHPFVKLLRAQFEKGKAAGIAEADVKHQERIRHAMTEKQAAALDRMAEAIDGLRGKFLSYTAPANGPCNPPWAFSVALLGPEPRATWADVLAKLNELNEAALAADEVMGPEREKGARG